MIVDFFASVDSALDRKFLFFFFAGKFFSPLLVVGVVLFIERIETLCW
jgi:hypothetical protein